MPLIKSCSVLLERIQLPPTTVRNKRKLESSPKAKKMRKVEDTLPFLKNKDAKRRIDEQNVAIDYLMQKIANPFYCFPCDSIMTDGNMLFWLPELNPLRKKQWLDYCNTISTCPKIPDLSGFLLEHCRRNIKLCSKHFDDKMFTSSAHNRLYPFAVPSKKSEGSPRENKLPESKSRYNDVVTYGKKHVEKDLLDYREYTMQTRNGGKLVHVIDLTQEDKNCEVQQKGSGHCFRKFVNSGCPSGRHDFKTPRILRKSQQALTNKYDTIQYNLNQCKTPGTVHNTEIIPQNKHDLQIRNLDKIILDAGVDNEIPQSLANSTEDPLKLETNSDISDSTYQFEERLSDYEDMENVVDLTESVKLPSTNNEKKFNTIANQSVNVPNQESESDRAKCNEQKAVPSKFVCLEKMPPESSIQQNVNALENSSKMNLSLADYMEEVIFSDEEDSDTENYSEKTQKGMICIVPNCRGNKQLFSVPDGNRTILEIWSDCLNLPGLKVGDPVCMRHFYPDAFKTTWNGEKVLKPFAIPWNYIIPGCCVPGCINKDQNTECMIHIPFWMGCFNEVACKWLQVIRNSKITYSVRNDLLKYRLCERHFEPDILKMSSYNTLFMPRRCLPSLEDFRMNERKELVKVTDDLLKEYFKKRETLLYNVLTTLTVAKPNTCPFKGCKNETTYGWFFRIPHDSIETTKKWLNFMDRSDVIQKGELEMKDFAKTGVGICVCHLDVKMIENEESYLKKTVTAEEIETDRHTPSYKMKIISKKWVSLLKDEPYLVKVVRNKVVEQIPYRFGVSFLKFEGSTSVDSN